jgi:hypothetical protein
MIFPDDIDRPDSQGGFDQMAEDGPVPVFDHGSAAGHDSVKPQGQQVRMVDKAAGPAAVDKTQMAILPELFHGQTGTFRDPVPEIPEGAVYIKKDNTVIIILNHMMFIYILKIFKFF